MKPGQKIQHWWRKLVQGQTPQQFQATLAQERAKIDPPSTAFDYFSEAYGFPQEYKGTRLKAPSYFTAAYGLELHNRADWTHTDARIQAFAAHFIEALRKQDIPMYVHTAFRTRAEQNRLRQEGKSRLGWPSAAHCQGKAVDIVHSRYHWNLTDAEWHFIGRIGQDVARKMGLKIRWGADWDNDGIPVKLDPDESFHDPAHWEVLGWSQEPIQDLHPIHDPNGSRIKTQFTPRKLKTIYRL